MTGPSHDKSLYRHRDLIEVKRALLSVSDKTGLVEFATALHSAGIELVSTGSTAATIRAAGIPVTDVAAVTGFPESLDGRVKTLHPAVHAGLLADLRLASHESQLIELGIDPFELVVVNLYPFVETVASGAVGDDVVEQIDIGGPAMVRASAKNFHNVAVVVSPEKYQQVMAGLSAKGGLNLRYRKQLAAAAFEHTAHYDTAVSQWFVDGLKEEDSVSFPDTISLKAQQISVLRYGENSHQNAALYASPCGRGIAQATQLHGKEMSYNNYVDADAALRAAYDFVYPAVAIIKHANPCGIAVAKPHASDAIANAHRRAHECDPVSAFGGVIAANRQVTLQMAETVSEIFTEVLIAPGFEAAALAVLTGKKNLRLLQLPENYAREPREIRQISGGILVQDSDVFPMIDPLEIAASWSLAVGEAVDEETLIDLVFAWKACRAVKSNAILLAKGGASVGVGMGQVNRVDSARLAVTRAGERAVGSVAASDAFFPFSDGLEILLDAGVKAVVQPGGSVRDDEVITAAKSAGIPMYLTGERHFFH